MHKYCISFIEKKFSFKINFTCLKNFKQKKSIAKPNAKSKEFKFRKK